VLTATDLGGQPVNIAAVDPIANVTVSISGATITLKADASTSGTRRVLATATSDATHRAARTIVIG
jgi:hypothetical protein